MLEPKKKGRKTVKPSVEELDMLYQKMTAQQVADHYGVALGTVRRWLVESRKELRENGNNR